MENPVLVLGHYGGHNTGDEAMLLGLMRGLADHGVTRLRVAAKRRSAVLEAPPGGVSVEVVGQSPWALAKAAAASRALVLGGGTHFHDDYAPRRYRRHLVYMGRLVAVGALMRLLGRPVAWVGMGFGPFAGWSAAWVTRVGLACCRLVTVRDTASARRIRGWIDEGRIERSFDLAALAVDGSAGEASSCGPPAGSGIVLGVSVLSLGALGGADPGLEARWEAALCEGLAGLLRAHPEITVRLVVIRGGSREDDRDVSDRLAGALVQAVPGACIERVSHDDDPRHMIAAMAACTHFVASRFHAGLLGFLLGCRLVLLGYHVKLMDLASDIGLDPSACLDPREPGFPEAFAEAVRDLVDPGSRRCVPGLPPEEARRLAAGPMARLADLVGRDRDEARPSPHPDSPDATIPS